MCVDWEGGASMPNYLRAAANTRLVGKQLAMLLEGKLALAINTPKTKYSGKSEDRQNWRALVEATSYI